MPYTIYKRGLRKDGVASNGLVPRFMARLKPKRSGQGEHTFSDIEDSVAAAHRVGVTIFAGTNSQDESNTFAHVDYGESLHGELELLGESRLPNLEVLRVTAASRTPTSTFPGRDVATQGKLAGFMLLRDSPAKDISAPRSIEQVRLGGIQYNDDSDDILTCLGHDLRG